MTEPTERAWLRAIAREIEDMALSDVIVRDGDGRKWWSTHGWVTEAAAREMQDELDREVAS